MVFTHTHRFAYICETDGHTLTLKLVWVYSLQRMTSHNEMKFEDDSSFQLVLKYVQDEDISAEEDMFKPILTVSTDLDMYKIALFCQSKNIKVLMNPGCVSEEWGCSSPTKN